MTEVQGRESSWMATVIILAECWMELKIQSKIEDALMPKFIATNRRFNWCLPFDFLKVTINCGCRIIFTFVFVVQLREFQSEIKMLEGDKRQLEVCLKLWSFNVLSFPSFLNNIAIIWFSFFKSGCVIKEILVGFLILLYVVHLVKLHEPYVYVGLSSGTVYVIIIFNCWWFTHEFSLFQFLLFLTPQNLS